MYGNNYIYEPIYIHTPLFFTSFWINSYRPYYSTWNWGYYPSYYYYWRPLPIYRYRRNVYGHTNHHYKYNYVNVRRSTIAINLHRNLRANSYEYRNPERSFERRNSSVSNRYELEQNRTSGTRNNTVSPRTNDRTPNSATRENRSETATPRVNDRTPNSNPRENRNETVSTRGNERPTTPSPRVNRNENTSNGERSRGSNTSSRNESRRN
jgi:hypothetical protein